MIGLRMKDDDIVLLLLICSSFFVFNRIKIHK